MQARARGGIMLMGLGAEIFQRGGAEAYVRCYTLHLLGGGMTQGGTNPPPLNYSPGFPCGGRGGRGEVVGEGL